MLWEKEIQKHFEDVILFLAKDENRETTVRIEELMKQLSIPGNLQTHVKNKLIHDRPRPVVAVAFNVHNPVLRINENGLELAKQIQKRIDDEAPKRFAEDCNTVLRFITRKENENQAFGALELSERLNIDVDTIEIIATEFENRYLIEASTTAGYTNFHVMPQAYLFVRTRKFTDAMFQDFALQLEHNVTDNSITTHISGGTFQGSAVGAHNKVESDENKIEIKSEEKKNFFQKILEDIRKAVVSHIVVAALSLIAGSAIGAKWLSQSPSQSASQQKPQNNTSADSSNKSKDSLDNIKK